MYTKNINKSKISDISKIKERYFKKSKDKAILNSKIKLITTATVLNDCVILGDKVKIKVFTTPSVFSLIHDKKTDTLQIYSGRNKKKNADIINTFKRKLMRDMKAILNNEIKQITARYYFKHFPVIIQNKKNEILLKNCMGYRDTYKVAIMPNVSVQISGINIILKSLDYDALKMTAARLKHFYRSNKYWLKLDKRIFRDGIYIL